MTDKIVKTRFAPSPTGLLHLGNIYSAKQCFDFAEQHGGTCILRCEDIDQERCKPEYEASIYEDLAWLGFEWPEPVRRQSEHYDIYTRHIQNLVECGLAYPCFCSRKTMRADQEKLIAQGEDVPLGPDGPLYLGTCRDLSIEERSTRIQAGEPFALRLNTQKALKLIEEQEGERSLRWIDLQAGLQQADPLMFGDIILARKDCPTSYHASVVIDDHLQGITHIVRGMDLFPMTHVHRLLQALWGFDVPEYYHHPLVLDHKDQPMSKRYGSISVHELREEQGMSVADVWSQIKLP